MSKAFLVKQLKDMSVIESVPYRPWCEGEHQESPVDFSLKNKKKVSGGESNDHIRSQLFVRTPDSGFSSPSESEFLKKQSSLMSPGDNYQNLYAHSSSLPIEEQTVPLALVKKKKSSGSSNDEILSSKSSALSLQSENSNLHIPTPSKDSNFLLTSQASAFQLLSSSLYWPGVSSSVNSSVPLTSLVSSAYDLTSQGRCLSSKDGHSTPIKSPSHSPDIVAASPIKRKTPTCTVTPEKKTKSLKKTKTSRRLNFDEDKTSPVSGTIIRQLEEGEEPLVVRKGDIDPAYNVVEITEEAKAELSKIENKIGDYVCRLCKELYDDAFGLAQHRCSRIIHVEYRCPECDKVFNCPANLASHRRWHKPKGNLSLVGSSNCKGIRNDLPTENTDNSKPETLESSSHTEILYNNNNDTAPTLTDRTAEPPELIPLPEMTSFHPEESNEPHECSICFKKFKRQSYLRKHLMTHSQCDAEDNEEILRTMLPMRSPSDHHVFSPTSPSMITPLLSPPFPDNVFRCRMCSATFFTPAALQLHSSTIHGSDEPSPLLSTALNVPLSNQYSTKGGMLSPTSMYSSYPFLHRSPQISAPS